MQVNDLRAEIQDFQERIFSGDPVEYNSAINQYVEPQATYTSALINTHGASRIKAIQALGKLFVRERVIDERGSKGGAKKQIGGWDEDSQTFTALTTTTYSLPFTLPLIDISLTFPTSLTLHLNINEDNDLDAEGNDSMVEDAGMYSDDDDEVDGQSSGAGRKGYRERDDGELSVYGERSRKYVVTKWEERGPVDDVLNNLGGLGRKIHLSLLRPLTTILILLLAGTQHFIHTHPLKNGYIAFVTAAFWTLLRETNEFVIRDVLGGLGGKQGGRVYRGNAYRPAVNRLTEQLPTSVLLSLGDSRSSTPTPSKSTSKGFQPRSGLGSTTSASAVNINGTTTQLQRQAHTGNEDLAEGATSYAGAVLDGTQHTHQHPNEVDSGDAEGGGSDQAGGDATSYAAAVEEGVKEGHIHPSNFEGQEEGTEGNVRHDNPSYAEVAAPE